MIAVLQRARDARVEVEGKVVGRIDHGLVILLGVFGEDKEEDADFLVNKIIHFRIFNDKDGKMNLSLKDVGGAVLVISQFTLCADWRKGRRPSFVSAAPPEQGKKLYEYFISRFRGAGIRVESGIFGAMMDVYLINCGPVTFVLDSRLKK